MGCSTQFYECILTVSTLSYGHNPSKDRHVTNTIYSASWHWHRFLWRLTFMIWIDMFRQLLDVYTPELWSYAIIRTKCPFASCSLLLWARMNCLFEQSAWHVCYCNHKILDWIITGYKGREVRSENQWQLQSPTFHTNLTDGLCQTLAHAQR